MLEFYAEHGSTAIIIFVAFVLSRAFLGCWLAAKKGYSQAAWFFLCFFFGLFALLVLGFVPQNTMKETNFNMTNIWKCPKCKIENTKDTFTCKNCGTVVTNFLGL